MAIEPPPPRSTSCSRAISSPPFHRLRSDEVWHFYAGSGLIVHVITPAGEYQQLLLGSSNPASGEHFQGVVPAGCWFGSSLRQPETFALVGCTVAPGFDFADFELR